LTGNLNKVLKAVLIPCLLALLWLTDAEGQLPACWWQWLPGGFETQTERRAAIVLMLACRLRWRPLRFHDRCRRLSAL
jgi:hypothetical protein